MAVITTLMATTPGIDELAEVKPPAVPTSPLMPYPITNRNSTGWTSPLTIRVRVRT